jgi:hypothetical protein
MQTPPTPEGGQGPRGEPLTAKRDATHVRSLRKALSLIRWAVCPISSIPGRRGPARLLRPLLRGRESRCAAATCAPCWRHTGTEQLTAPWQASSSRLVGRGGEFDGLRRLLEGLERTTTGRWRSSTGAASGATHPEAAANADVVIHTVPWQRWTRRCASSAT